MLIVWQKPVNESGSCIDTSLMMMCSSFSFPVLFIFNLAMHVS